MSSELILDDIFLSLMEVKIKKKKRSLTIFRETSFMEALDILNLQI